MRRLRARISRARRSCAVRARRTAMTSKARRGSPQNTTTDGVCPVPRRRQARRLPVAHIAIGLAADPAARCAAAGSAAARRKFAHARIGREARPIAGQRRRVRAVGKACDRATRRRVRPTLTRGALANPTSGRRARVARGCDPAAIHQQHPSVGELERGQHFIARRPGVTAVVEQKLPLGQVVARASMRVKRAKLRVERSAQCQHRIRCRAQTSPTALAALRRAATASAPGNKATHSTS